MKKDWSVIGLLDRATSLMEAAMHSKPFWGTGVFRYSHGVSAPGKDVHDVDAISGGF
jgi:hypothetical protein